MKINAPHTVYFVSLGCPKNRVDTERMAARLTGRGFHPVTSPDEASLILVNTCAFIESATEESLDTILELASYKESGRCDKLVVTGCLVGRYGSELSKSLPEVDLFLDTRELDRALRELDKLGTPLPRASEPPARDRLLSTPPHFAYLKIAEGCDNRCTYCIIPKLKGPFRSVPIDPLVREAEELARRGVRELILVAQDTTRYGTDLSEASGPAELTARLSNIHDLRWIRMLYLYPEKISGELLDVVHDRENLLPYFDLPIQHVSRNVLKGMGRSGISRSAEELVETIRRRIPEAVIRMTVMVGFPGESDKDFQELFDFVNKVKPQHLGGFRFHAEEGVPASRFPHQVPREVQEQRLQWILELQAQISLQHNKSRIGHRETVLVEGPSEDRPGWMEGRTWRHAPEIDGLVLFEGKASPGDWVTVEITDADEYDLMGRRLEPA